MQSDLIKPTLDSSSAGNIHDSHFESIRKRTEFAYFHPRLTATANQGVLNAAKAGLVYASYFLSGNGNELNEGSLISICKDHWITTTPTPTLFHREGRSSVSS